MDIIAAIDAVTGCQYQPCGRQLDDNSPSPDFCSPQHQAAWLAARTVPLERDDEPVDLAAHVFNATEWHHPETCVACTENRWCPDRSAGADVTVQRPGDERSVVAALRRAATHGGYYLEVLNAFDSERSPAEVFIAPEGTPPSAADVRWEPFGHLSGEAVWSGLGVDGARDAPLTHFEVLRGGEIRVNFTLDTSWASADASPLDDLIRWAEIYGIHQRTVDGFRHILEPPEVPADVRQRALEARRNRNTGPPPPKRRAPRNLPPRRV